MFNKLRVDDQPLLSRYSLSLANKIRLIVAILVSLTVISVTFVLYLTQREAIEQAAIKRANSLTFSLAGYASDYLYEDRIDEARMMAKRMLREPDIVGALIIDGFGFVVADGDKDSARLFDTIDDPLVHEAISTQTLLSEVRGRQLFTVSPSIVEQGLVGGVAVTTSLDSMRDELDEAVKQASIVGILALIFAIAASHFLVAQLRRPLALLQRGTRHVAEGNIAHRLEITSGDELEELADAFNHMLDQLQAALHHTEQLAYNDQLTGLPNRLELKRQLDEALADKKRERPLALMFLDVDKFKLVNDTFGHEVGDKLLRHFADTVRLVLESHCAGAELDFCNCNHPIVARMGGDEFTIVLPGLSSPDEAGQIAADIIAKLDEPFRFDERELRVGTSIGIAIAQPGPIDGETLLQQADIAMYAAKTAGRGRFTYFELAMQAVTTGRVWIEQELRKALKAGDLDIYAQPQFNTQSLEPVGVELLARWYHKEIGPIPPDQFIPVAEETGLIRSLGSWIFEQGCIWAKRWADEGFPNFRVAVNVSAQQIEYAGFVEDIERLLLKTGTDPSMIEIELTESTMMARPEETAVKLRCIRELGIQIAIDDFGTGYSSLGKLKHLPFDRLKIDRSFVNDIPGDKDDLAITAAIAALGHSMGFALIAEGLETQEQLEFVRELKCDEVQGYLLSRPMPIEEVGDWLSMPPSFTESGPQYDQAGADLA